MQSFLNTPQGVKIRPAVIDTVRAMVYYAPKPKENQEDLQTDMRCIDCGQKPRYVIEVADSPNRLGYITPLCPACYVKQPVDDLPKFDD